MICYQYMSWVFGEIINGDGKETLEENDGS